MIVRLDSPTADPVSPPPFTGQHVIDAGENEDFLFVDQVMADWKPTPAGGVEGIKVIGTDSTLMIDAEEHDDDTNISANGSVVLIEDASLNDGRSELGTGVSTLIIRTNDVDADDFYPDGGTIVHSRATQPNATWLEPPVKHVADCRAASDSSDKDEGADSPGMPQNEET